MNEKSIRTASEPDPAPEQKPADEAFLSRWSRLKAEEAARRRETEEAKPAPVSEACPPPAETDDANGESPGELELPPLETLDENSDYSAFMSPQVSSALRKQALRKLFRSQKFNYICELDDYIDDYTSFPVLGDIVTADMKHAAERLLRQQLEAGMEGEEAAAAIAAAKDQDSEAPGTVAATGAAQAAEPAEGAGSEPAEGPDMSEEKQRDA